jgi:molybdate transport system ATP-binding protein
MTISRRALSAATATHTHASLLAEVEVRRGAFQLDARLEVGGGETVALMGPSHSGTSTLLEVIAGMIRPTTGFVQVDERIVSSTKPRRHVRPADRGLVLVEAEPHLFPHLSIRDNVAFGRRVRGTARALARADADEWLWRVGLPGMGDHRPQELSVAQQYRAAIARALATAPAAMLVDARAEALDAAETAAIRDILRELLGTAVVVTRDGLDAVALADRLYVLERGRVVQHGPVAAVLAAPATAYIARVAGLNRVEGVGGGGRWQHDAMVLESADAASRRLAGVEGPLVAVFRPGAVRLEALEATTWTGALRLDALTLDAPKRPNEWLAPVERLDQTPSGVRVRTPLCAVDLPVDAAAGVSHGSPVRLRIDPADVRFVRP